MSVKDKENEAIQALFEKREAGVEDLLEFYTRVEAVYVSASKALEQSSVVTASNSANLG
jgi:hypothetical protein